MGFDKFGCLVILLVICVSCRTSDPVEDQASLFRLVSPEESGITFTNTVRDTPELNILNYLYFYNGAGVAAADFNNDGLSDLYFTSNTGADKLYLNSGGLTFTDITEASGISNASGWTSGVTVVDINNDGLLDLYVCKVTPIFDDSQDANRLYINNGQVNGIPTFEERAADYGLDARGYATSAIFFDYDLDADLDMFLLNHSVHPNSNYGNGSRRSEADSLSGDRLFENRDGQFTDVSEHSGIFQGKIGYGLGVSVGDVNNDGYPDIYVGNDFFENDYLYINQKDGTFVDLITSDETRLGHTSHYSMGNALTDINNDAWLDIVSLDMLPEDLVTYKTSGLEYPYQTYQYYLKNGYAPQFMQNTLHLNRGGERFSEVAHISGIAATEWSWSPLIADFDNDGHKDLYITNGILGATNDMDFINFISNETIQQQLGGTLTDKEMAFIAKIPEKKLVNYLFRNTGDGTFENNTDSWSATPPSFSNGAAYADLDNDGDLDLVVNNVNESAFLLENTLIGGSNTHYLKIKFEGPEGNRSGIGAKVRAYQANECLSAENFTNRGYLSAVSPEIHLGLGNRTAIDSLTVIWPGGAFQTINELNTNAEITLDFSEASGNYYESRSAVKAAFLVNADTLVDFEHTDPEALEFNRDPLIPFSSTNLGPHSAVADINNDSWDDLFICGGKTQPSALYVQSEAGEFTAVQTDIFTPDAISEDVHAQFFDANGDAYLDLIVVSGGNEFQRGKPLQPRLYLNNKGTFEQDTTQFRDLEINASKVRPVDIDNDGDTDLAITANLVPWRFGVTPGQYVFRNDGAGNFENISQSAAAELQDLGNVQDLVWADMNADGKMDAVMAGHWMPVAILLSDGEKLRLQQTGLEESHGWWNVIKAADFDKDGDLDIVAGNWGLNSRLKASADEPITLYNNDYDDNGTVDPVITHYHSGTETPFASKDELAKQMPFLNKNFLSYKDFAAASFDELLPEDKLMGAQKKYAYELASCYFENLGNGNFKKRHLPFNAQISVVKDIAVDDFNNDGFSDLFLVGNNYNISTQLGKLDASHGIILLNDGSGFFYEPENLNFSVSGPARGIEKFEVRGDWYFVVTINNERPIFLKEVK